MGEVLFNKAQLNKFQKSMDKIIKDLHSADLTRIEVAQKKFLNLDRKKVFNLIKINLEHSDSDLRCQAIELFVILRDKSVNSVLLPLFEDPIDYVRFNLLNELLQNNYLDAIFVEPLIEILERDHDADVRFLAVGLLGRIGDFKAIPALIKAKENDFGMDYEGEIVSNAAIDAIQEINNLSTHEN